MNANIKLVNATLDKVNAGRVHISGTILDSDISNYNGILIKESVYIGPPANYLFLDNEWYYVDMLWHPGDGILKKVSESVARKLTEILQNNLND